MKLLTTEKARTLCGHPLVNFSEVARQFYNGRKQKRPDQALRVRLYGHPSQGGPRAEISAETLERLTAIFSRLYSEIVDGEGSI